MTTTPYINIHVHNAKKTTETITVQNLFPGDEIPVFSGRNFYSAGIHPWDVGTKKENNKALLLIEEALELPHVIFVGESGLDKLADADFAEQCRIFEAQAIMSEKFEYPLVIHCVKAYNEVIELRKKLNPAMPWIMHGYNGSVEITKQMADLGILFSFGKNILHDESKAVKSLKTLTADKIFFETDESDIDVKNSIPQGYIVDRHYGRHVETYDMGEF